MTDDLLIWPDAYDPDQWAVGYFNTRIARRVVIVYLHVDQIHDMFGSQVFHEMSETIESNEVAHIRFHVEVKK